MLQVLSLYSATSAAAIAASGPNWRELFHVDPRQPVAETLSLARLLACYCVQLANDRLPERMMELWGVCMCLVQEAHTRTRLVEDGRMALDEEKEGTKRKLSWVE